MAFDETPVYVSDVAAGDEGTPNLMSSMYVQRAALASRPAQGNKGATFIASDDANGERLYWDDGSSWIDIGLIAGSAARAWCQVAASGALGSPDFNVASITDTGTGDRTVVWDTDFATSVYAVAIAPDNTTTNNIINNHEVDTYAAGSFRLRHYDGLGGITAVDQICGVAAWGQQ